MIPLIVPTPKERTDRSQGYRAGASVTVFCSRDWLDAAAILRDGLRRQGVATSLERTGRRILTIGKPSNELNAPDKSEGNAVRSDSSGVSLAAHDRQGRIWAVQTLLQLFDGAEFHGTEIRDWPTLSFRGVHLFHGPQARPFHEKLIERVFPRSSLTDWSFRPTRSAGAF